MERMFKEREPGKFQYRPVFWDPEKEEREARKRRIEAEQNIRTDGTYTPNIEGKFREMYRKRKDARRAFNGRYAVRMFLILVLILLVAFHLMSKYGEKLVDSFM